MKLIKQYLNVAIALFLLTFFNVSNAENADKNRINIGFGPSAYLDQFKESIQPILEKKGYEINIVVVSQNRQLVPTLKEGSIDANVNLSYANMINMGNLFDINIHKLVDTASAPQSIRSSKHQSINDVKKGMKVLVPNDPMSQERAVQLLETIGWITLKKDVDTARFSLNDILDNPYNLDIIAIDGGQLLRGMDDADFIVVNGNYIANAGQKINDGLVVEKTPEQHTVIVTVRDGEQNERWAKDLKAAYESQEFQAYVKSNPKYEGYILPKNWQ